MARVDIRISVSFKNNQHDVELHQFIKEKGEFMGYSTYIKMLVQKAMLEDKEKNPNK